MWQFLYLYFFSNKISNELVTHKKLSYRILSPTKQFHTFYRCHILLSHSIYKKKRERKNKPNENPSSFWFRLFFARMKSFSSVNDESSQNNEKKKK